MAWLYLLVVAPVYGVVAAQCLVQGFTYLALVLISLMGFSKGSAPRDELLAALGASLLGVLIFAALLAGGVYLMHSYTAFGQ